MISRSGGDAGGGGGDGKVGNQVRLRNLQVRAHKRNYCSERGWVLACGDDGGRSSGDGDGIEPAPSRSSRLLWDNQKEAFSLMNAWFFSLSSLF